MHDIERMFAERGYSPETEARYRPVLVALLAVYGERLDRLTAAELLAFVRRPGWGNSQQRVALAACKTFLRWRFGDAHPALSARVRRKPPKPQRYLSPGDAARLLGSFETWTAKGSRDYAIAALALDTGLRVSELCRLALRDVDLQRGRLVVWVKGGRWGAAVFSAVTAAAVADWLRWRETVAAPGVGTLYVNIRTGRPLTRDGLQTIVRRWGERLGLRLSPHDLRRTFAVLSTVNGAPSRLVQLAGRWSSIEMVEAYTRGMDQSAIRPYLPVAHLLGD